jgi:1-acyl-sn-glycerol-3-phosphate acyltransferase
MYTPTVTDRVVGSAALRRRQRAGRAIARLLGRIEVSGVQLVPADGPVVLAVNHRAFLDGPLLFALLPRPVSFLVKIEAFTPRMAPLLRGTGQIPVIRNNRDVAAVRFTLRVLHSGGVIGMFPEGTRGDGLVRTARPGVGYFALRTGAKVVPVACHGTEVLTKRHSVRRPPVRITVGAPFEVGRVPSGQLVKRHHVLAATEQIRATLAELVDATSAGHAAEVGR